MKRSASAILLVAALALALGACATSGTPMPSPVTRAFANPAAITVPGEDAATQGPASPYPSPIVVTDMPASVTKVVVTLSALSHAFPDDLDVLLVGPAGQHVLLMSDVGGGAAVVNLELLLDAFAVRALPDAALLQSGTFRPMNFGEPDPFPMPAPAGPYATDLTVFAGTNPNGTWNLYVVDDALGDVGAIGGGWSLSITAR
jgi:subtilisin-like proprotein convertase family protein